MALEQFSDQDKLDCVKQSPAAVAEHDKQRWLKLFATDGWVNDPVGSKPHTTPAAIERFYETFIAPNQIHFDVEHDVVCGNTVIRDLIIETTMSTGLKVDVPTHIRYELVEEQGQLKVHRLYAHWELSPMVLQTLKAGLPGLITYSKLSVHMIRCQGLGGVFGFMKGFGGVGKTGKRHAEQFLRAMSLGRSSLPDQVLAEDASFDMWSFSSMQLDDFAEELKGLSWKKVMAAGRTVTATVMQGERRGMALFMFNNARQISRVRFYF